MGPTYIHTYAFIRARRALAPLMPPRPTPLVEFRGDNGVGDCPHVQ